MNDPLKSGLKTSEGIFAALSLLVSSVISLLVVLGVVDPSSQEGLTEMITKAVVALGTLVVATVALRQYIIGRTELKAQQMELLVDKKTVTG